MKVLQYYAIVISVVNVSNKMQQARDIRERARAVFLVGVVDRRLGLVFLLGCTGFEIDLPSSTVSSCGFNYL